LNVINIPLPSLRDRKEDIPLLIHHFFDGFCQENNKFLKPDGKSLLEFEPDALQLLMEHNWPGNVRELENAVERAVVLSNGPIVPITVLPDSLLHAGGIRIRTDDTGNLPADASLYEIVAAYERQRIIQVLETVNYSQTEAAEMLRIPLSTLNQKIKRLSIDIKKGARPA